MTPGTDWTGVLREARRRVAVGVRTLARREVALAAVILAVPLVALAQPLGLLLWARMRILTSIPRTALATEDVERVAAVPNDLQVFPDLPSVVPGPAALRDPLVVSPDHFPRSTNCTSDRFIQPKSAPGTVDESVEAEESIRTRLVPVVSRLEVQGLMPGRGLAVIDGRVRRAGEEFEGSVAGATFHLVEVRKSVAVVRVEGLDFDIRLNGGGTGSVDIRP